MKMDLTGPYSSESLYRSLIEQLPVGIFRKDAEGRYILANAYFCNLRDKNPGDILGKTPKELALNNPSESEVRLLLEGAVHHDEIMRTGKPIEVEEEYYRPDGSKIWMRVLKSPAFDLNGMIVGSQGLMVEITQRKQTEAQLSHEQSLLRALLQNSADCIYFKDCESRFTCCSEKMVKLFGLQHVREMLGKRDSDFFGEHAREAFNDEQQIIQTGKPIVDKVEKENWQDGRVTWALTNKMPFRDEAGKIIGTFGISKDITALKEAEAKLTEVHGQLMVASRQAGMAEVATSVLHNVGNVLNSVNVSSLLIAEKIRQSKVASLPKVIALLDANKDRLGDFFGNDPKGKQLADYLATLASHLAQEQEEILKEVAALAENVHHIKEIVSMQQNYAKTFGVMEQLSPADLVEDALRLNSGAVSRHNIKVIREFADVPPILTEKHKVLQILVNLIRNAKHACDDSGRTDKEITLRVTNGDGRIKISVIDNGIGIPAENLTRIFNHGFTTRQNGHGFGLHSGALAAKEIGGSLNAFSDGPSRGATFTLELPVNGKNDL